MMTLALVIVIIFLGIITMLVLGRRLSLTLGGTSAPAKIVGYEKGERDGRRYSYNYKVKFMYEGQEYESVTMEGFSLSMKEEPEKNLGKDVTVCFSPEAPEVVTIKEFKATLYVGIFSLVAMIAAILVALWANGVIHF